MSRLSRVFPLGEVHLRQAGTVALEPGIVVASPQSAEPLSAQAAAGVEPAQFTHTACMYTYADKLHLTQSPTQTVLAAGFMPAKHSQANETS